MQDHESTWLGLRAENMVRCAAHLRAHGPCTVTELAVATGLSRPTTRDRLHDLVERELVTELSPAETPLGGRPAARYAFRSDAGLVAAAELNKHFDRVLLCTLEGRILDGVRVERSTDTDPERRLTDLRNLILERAAALAPEAGRLHEVGLALPGVLTPEGGIALSPIFPTDSGEFAAATRAMFHVPVLLSNDVDAATYAEQRIGAAQGLSDVVFVLVWHQVAGGLILGGRPHLGRRHLAGELNQLVGVHRDTPPAEWADVPVFRALMERSRRDDRNAARSVEEFIRITAIQVAAVVLTVDPEVVVLGGPLIEDAEFAERVRTQIHRSFERPVDVRICLSDLREDGPVLGVLLRALAEATSTLLGQALPDPALLR